MTASRRYLPGAWIGVVGERVTVLLPPDEKHRAGGLWELVDDGAGFDVVLDALVSAGLRDLPGFVLVSTDADTTRVVVRGEARVRLTTAAGEEVVDGASGGTWAERTVVGATSVRVDAGREHDVAQDELLPIPGGLVRVDAVEQQPDPEPETVDTGSLPTTQASPFPDPDHAGDTRLGRAPEPAADPTLDPEADPGQVGSAGPVARLVFSHGADVAVDGVVVVGRAPEGRRFPAGEQPRLVTVPSPQQEISSVHLEVRPGADADHGAAVVTDLGSTNGTVLVQPGLPPEELPPGTGVALLPGAVLDLGDEVTIRVVSP